MSNQIKRDVTDHKMDHKMDKVIKLHKFFNLCEQSPSAFECISDFEIKNKIKIIDLPIPQIEKIASECCKCVVNKAKPCPL